MSIVRTLIGNIKGPKGDTGATGATGANGADGVAATINVGTVTTSAYGTTAQVTNSGTESAAVFDFVIPQGKPGEETTRMSGLTLDQITAQSASMPVPAVGESGSVIWGKVVKFFNDVKTSLATKLSGSDCVTVLTSSETQKPLAASAGKTLNDAITTLSGKRLKYKQLQGTSAASGTIGIALATSNAIISIINLKDDRVRFELRRDSGVFYAAAFDWGGTSPKANYDYHITVVYVSWADIIPQTS